MNCKYCKTKISFCEWLFSWKKCISCFVIIEEKKRLKINTDSKNFWLKKEEEDLKNLEKENKKLEKEVKKLKCLENKLRLLK